MNIQRFCSDVLAQRADGIREYFHADAYEYGCYESDTSRYKKGTAEKVRDTFLEMLKGLKEG